MENIFEKSLDGLANEAQEVEPQPEDIREISVETYEAADGEIYFVAGNPFEVAEKLDWSQGDNSYDALGCCGLVSCSNVLTICGLDTTEESVVAYAVENNICRYSPFLPPESRGGTLDPDIIAVLAGHGVEASAFSARDIRGSVEGIASAVEDGHGVTIGVNGGYLWDDANYIGTGAANHQVTVTGSVRDVNGQVVGLVICDSGRGLQSDSCRILSLEKLAECYSTVPDASAVITDNPVR